jgi:hypothetical protein
MNKTYIVLLVVALALILAWLINMDLLFSKPAPVTNNQLQADLNECIAISEKSVAHMDAKVAFQQLEIIGRKARVMRLCMKDHAYTQNPDWTLFGESSAKALSQNGNISFDEAFETLRRTHMVQLNTPNNNTPLFWSPTP